MKFSVRTIPAAAAMTAALMFGAQAHAQVGATTVPGTTNSKDAPSSPAAAGSSKSMQQGDMAKPMAKPMAKQGSMGAGGTDAMSPGSAEQPVRQADKVAKNKGERMEKGSNQKSSMNKSSTPVRESDIKDAPAK